VCIEINFDDSQHYNSTTFSSDLLEQSASDQTRPSGPRLQLTVPMLLLDVNISETVQDRDVVWNTNRNIHMPRLNGINSNYLEWFWVTAKFSTSQTISRPLYDSWAYCYSNKCIGDDTKGAARRSPNCIRKTKYVLSILSWYLSRYRNSLKNCFLAQNFTEIGQLAAELWPKRF